MDVDIELNVNTLPKASQEYIALTTLHESIHAYLYTKGYFNQAISQYDVMWSSYIDVIAGYLNRNYGTDINVARILATDGLQSTFGSKILESTYKLLQLKTGAPTMERGVISSQYRTGKKVRNVLNNSINSYLNNMQIKFNHVLLLTYVLMTGCTANKNAKWVGKFSQKDVYDRNIDKDSVGVQIYLYDVLDRKTLDISDIKKLPGNVRDSTFNSKLLYFHKDAVPRSMDIIKPGKGPVYIYPSQYKKNLIIYKVFLAKDIRGVM